MEAINAILTRRSVRTYTEEQIDSATLRTLLECGMAAPTAVNSRDWAFVVVTDRDQLQRIAACNGHAARMLPTAAAAIVVCGDTSRAYKGAPDYWIVDAAAATQNILLAAHALGLGAVWLGTWPQEHKVKGISEILEIPSHIVPLSVISLGHPAPEARRERPLYEEDRVHFDRW